MTKEQEINLLQREIAITERSPNYTFRWNDAVITLYRAEILKDKLLKQLTPKQLKNTLQPVREQAIAKSKKFPSKKVFVNVDDKGNCFVTNNYDKDATVFCYRNGGQVSLDSNKKQKESATTLNINDMATKAKNNKKEVKKSSNKPEKKIALAAVNGLTYNGKGVSVPAGRAAKWSSLLKKPNVKKEGFVTIKGLAHNKKAVFLPKGKAKVWQSILDKFCK